MTEKIRADWLANEDVQRVLSILNADGEEARIVGGAVRNQLLGRAITDVDIATTALPQLVMERAAKAGVKAVPTGVDHGTVTLVVNGRPFEVTTLRRDHETDGRHAKVIFGRDWRADAERRDFTINALYCDADGTILDLVGGIADIEKALLRFIGDASARITEDYLRILRFYRFFAWYGSGRPDADGIRATTRLKDGLEKLSAERVWSELRKTLAAPDPSRALLWMRQTGVLTAVLPESERWGIDAVHGLTSAEVAFGWPADAMLRLASIVPPDAARLASLADRLRFSAAERTRLLAFAMAEAPKADTGDGAMRHLLFHGDRIAIADNLKLAIAALRTRPDHDLSELATLVRRLDEVQRFDPPAMPVSGKDLLALGIPAGPQIGDRLRTLQDVWIESGFALGRDALLALARP